MMFEGSHESVRACSRFRSLPSTSQWAQVQDFPNASGPGRKWTGEYICLRFIEVPTANGGTIRVRPVLTLEKLPTQPGADESFQVSNLPKRMTFPTRAAAVGYACANIHEM